MSHTGRIVFSGRSHSAGLFNFRSFIITPQKKSSLLFHQNAFEKTSVLSNQASSISKRRFFLRGGQYDKLLVCSGRVHLFIFIMVSDGVFSVRLAHTMETFGVVNTSLRRTWRDMKKELVVVKQKKDGALVRFQTSLQTSIRLMDRNGTDKRKTHQKNITNAVRHHLLASCDKN